MAIKSRAQRELERKLKAKKNRTQLLGATRKSPRQPMQQGYTTTKVEPPKFQESNVVGDLTQAGLAYKGGKGIFDWTEGAEAYTDKAGKFHKAVEPYAMPDIGGRLSQMGEGVSNFGQNLWNNQQGVTGLDTGEFGSSWFGTPRAEALSGLNEAALTSGDFSGQIWGMPNADLSNATPFGSVMEKFGAPQNVSTLPSQAPMHSSFAPTGTQLSSASSVAPQAIDKLGLAGSGLGVGLNAYDISQQGATPGNILGLGGSAVLGLNALGMANAWNPAGWAMLGAGTLGSLLDWEF